MSHFEVISKYLREVGFIILSTIRISYNLGLFTLFKDNHRFSFQELMRALAISAVNNF